MYKNVLSPKRGLRIALAAVLLIGLMLSGTGSLGSHPVKAASRIADADFLKTNGTTIRKNKGSGDTVYLRGTNAGGWLVQENWMNPTDAPDQKTMMNTFKNRFGASVRDELIKVYEDNYWTTQDFDNMANMGMTVVRLPFTYMNLVDDNGNLKSNAWSRLDWFVENSRQRGIYVILDMHGAFGSQNGMDHSGEINDGNQLYDSPGNREKTLKLWEQIAAHYKGNPAVAGYDILNEPGIKAGLTGKKQWDFYNEIYKRIRAVDSEHIVIMESCWDADHLPRPSDYGWTNVVYEYHYYPWGMDNDAAGQKSYIDGKVSDINGHNYGVPTFIGEFTSFVSDAAWKNTLSVFNREGWHWTTWSYKSTASTGGTNSWGIYNHNPGKVNINSDSADVIRQKWSNVGTQNGWVNTQIYNIVKAYTSGKVDAGTGTGSGSTLANGEYYLTASGNNNVVTADNAGASPLIASRASLGGAWETLKLENNSDGTVSFKSMANQKYVCAVIDESNQLLARSASIGTWEKFRLVGTGNGDYGIQAVANGKYVQANLNAGGRLEATQDKVAGSWEAFKITRIK
ncbi:cellulase family glycosylhydrolase [Saccharibacillus sp. CPCC 101409]|uniref:cellulase family glycosylhydrolase n=1 Tax=Saccharibacillus sp. CPCC 101409 TaxID=3058041 RepID=UPI0026739392|nr:cellulase family glycosylhydrolase [Saccharibacillus sp. CPCC 101409]MDO3409321.1 cellulase family glycosylhydrolase [Saccharibacillus sp. CPCC 101409]